MNQMTEERLLKRIVINPKIMLGKPVIKGTRLTVEIIVEKIAYGETILLYAAKRLAHEEVYTV